LSVFINNRLHELLQMCVTLWLNVNIFVGGGGVCT
jgi:hypothetical protein